MANCQEINWNSIASGIIKSILARKNMKYHDLARLLQEIGINENQNSIANKLSRGTFSFTFVLQCMCVLEVDTLETKN